MAIPNPTTRSASDRILRLPEVINTVGLKKAEIYKRIARKDFPQQIHLGANVVGWSEREVQSWITAQLAARDQAAA